MKKVRDNSMIPQGGAWIWEDPETKFVIKHSSYQVLMGKAKDYRRNNNLPIGTLFDEEFERIICERLPEACIDFTPPSPFEQAASLTKALFRWAQAGLPTRTEEQVKAIQEICQGCNFFGGNSGLLKIACQKCRCSKKKLYLATEHCPISRW